MTVGMLLEAIERRIPDGAAGAVAERFGESEDATEIALRGMISSILAGVCLAARDERVLAPLFEGLGAPENRDFVGGALGAEALSVDDPMRAGISQRFLNDLFRARTEDVLDTVAEDARVGRRCVEGLAGLAVPLVTGALGDRITERDLEPEAFRRYLASEQAIILRAAPAGVAAMLADQDFAGDGYGADDGVNGRQRPGGRPVGYEAAVGRQAGAPVAPARLSRKAGGRAPWGWAIPVLVVGGLIGWFARQAPAEAPRIAVAEGEDLKDVGALAGANGPGAEYPQADFEDDETAGVELAGSLGAVTPVREEAFEAPRLTVEDLGGAPDGVEAKLLEFLASGREPCVAPECWHTFDRLAFAPGSVALDLEASGAQLQNIARIMAAYPDLELKFAGYTDKTGGDDLNMRLSQERADAVMAAVVDLGVAPERLVAEGYGAQFPVADNETEEGRAKNRRISVRVRRF